MLFALRVPASNDRGPAYMEQALAAVHQSNPARHAIVLEFGQDQGSVALFLRCPSELRSALTASLYAHYPDARLDLCHEPADAEKGELHNWSLDLTLTPDLFPMKRHSQFEDALNRVISDPLSPLLTALAGKATDRLQPRIAITVRPAVPRHRKQAEQALRQLAHPQFRDATELARRFATLACAPGWWSRWRARHIARRIWHSGIQPLDPFTLQSSSRLHEREDDLQAAGDKLSRLLFECRIRISISGPNEKKEQAHRKLQEIAGSFGPFSLPRLASFRIGLIQQQHVRRQERSWRGFLLSAEELATLFHPPTQNVRAPAMAHVESRELEPPVGLPTPTSHAEVAIFGETAFRGQRQRFGLLPDDRLRHAVILGKTGMGKSTLLHQLIVSDLVAGHGLGLIDPHGDLSEAVLRSAPSHRTNDIVFFDAADGEFPISFNPLACDDPKQRPLVASGVLAAFKKLFGHSWGPRLEHILRNSLLTLLETPSSTLLTLLRLLGDAPFRQNIVSKISDPIVRAFWLQEFAGMPAKLQAEAIAPVQNKVGHFVSSPLLRNIVGQSRQRLDLRQMLDEGKVLVVNLSKGRLGDDASGLLGSLLVTSLQLAAMSRADMPEALRRPFYLYVDEFQNFATESFATILSEARKYRLGLTLAHQFLAQLDEATRSAVFGNVGTMVAFQVGADDAEIVAEQLGAEAFPSDLLQLPKHTAVSRLLVDGMPSRPFTIKTLPPPTTTHDPRRADVIRTLSRRRYTQAKAITEQEIEAQYGKC